MHLVQPVGADHLLYGIRVQPQDRRHTAATRVRHQSPALLHQPQAVFETDGPRRVQRHVFSDTMAKQIIRHRAVSRPVQVFQRADDVKCRLGKGSIRQPLDRAFDTQVDDRVAKHIVSRGCLLRMGREHIGTHADPLRALAWKHERLHWPFQSRPGLLHSPARDPT